MSAPRRCEVGPHEFDGPAVIRAGTYRATTVCRAHAELDPADLEDTVLDPEDAES